MPNDDDWSRSPTAAGELEAWSGGPSTCWSPSADVGTPTLASYPSLEPLRGVVTKRAVIRPVMLGRAAGLRHHPADADGCPPPRHRSTMSPSSDLAVHRVERPMGRPWEAAQFRRRFFDQEEDLTPDLAEIADRGDINIMFVPRTPSRYYEYAPLYHLLPRDTCERFGLPLLGEGNGRSGSSVRTCRSTCRSISWIGWLGLGPRRCGGTWTPGLELQPSETPSPSGFWPTTSTTGSRRLLLSSRRHCAAFRLSSAR